jgi:hypothetical protein
LVGGTVSNQANNFESVIEQMLAILDENDVSLEDGVAITANLFMMSVTHMGEVSGKDSLESIFELLNIEPPRFDNSIIPHNRIGNGRGWGMDPNLLTEDN